MNERTPAHASDGVVSRRTVLAAAVGVLSALIAAVVGIPSALSLLGRSGESRSKSGRFMRVAALASLPIGQPVNLKNMEMTEQAYIRTREMRDVWVVRTSETELKVYSPICPHLGCRYNWNPEAGEFACPCHGSVWSVDGRVLAGPSPRPLDTLPIRIIGRELYVQWEVFEVGIPEKRMI